MKQCYKCKNDFELNELNFGKDKSKKDNLSIYCRGCLKEKGRNRDKVKSRLRCKRYHEKNREKILNNKKLYRTENKEEISLYMLEWRDENKEHISEYFKEYQQENKVELNEKKKVYEKHKYHTDILYKLPILLRCRLYQILKNDKKTSSAVKFLGCPVDEFKIYLEKQFYPNPETGELMTWDNHSKYGWHLDHKIPLNWFDLKDPEQAKKACYYTNIQPLWAKENLSKKDRYAD